VGCRLAREEHCRREEGAGGQVELNVKQQRTRAAVKADLVLRCMSKDIASRSGEVVLWA